MAQFIAYRISGAYGFDARDAVPIAVGDTRDAAMEKAIRRVLSACDLRCSIDVQENADLSADDFAALGKITDEWAAHHGLVS